jgi:hypothetical protein
MSPRQAVGNHCAGESLRRCLRILTIDLPPATQCDRDQQSHAAVRERELKQQRSKQDAYAGDHGVTVVADETRLERDEQIKGEDQQQENPP